MTELTYTREQFPIAGILEDLTEEVKVDRLTPFEAYFMTEERLSARGIWRGMLDYDSTSITTGGHARLPEKNMGEIISANTRTARQMVAMLALKGDIEPTQTMLPVDLGNTGWSQAEFMTYWALNIGGPDTRELANRPHGLTQFENAIEDRIQREVDLETMRNGKLGRDMRQPEYMKYVSIFADTFKEPDVLCTPIRRFVQLVDTKISLGCEAEDELRSQLSINAYKVAAVRAAEVSTLPVSTLREDLRVIMAQGGEVVVAPQDSMLTLVRI